jgi:2-hydroxychromene-2-carboxylate isomerase
VGPWSAARRCPTTGATTIDFAFDYASPWAFLASATVAERFRGLEVAYVPAYLRGFDAFRTGVPYSPAKLFERGGAVVDGKAFYLA